MADDDSIEELLNRIGDQIGVLDLVATTPHEAVEEHLAEVKSEEAWDTYRTHRSVLNRFQEWLETDDVEITNINELTGSHLADFKIYLKNRGNQKTSLNGALSTFRVFIKFCENNEYVTLGLSEKVSLPNVSDNSMVRTDPPSDAVMTASRSWLQNNEPTSRRRVEFELIRFFGFRCGTVRAIDAKDYDHEQMTLRVEHRPAEDDDKKGTPLKNGNNSTRVLNLPPYLNELLQQYVEHDPNRDGNDEISDEYGRTPLLTSKDREGEIGRPSTTTIKRDMYKLTRPCRIGLDCPDDLDPDDCEPRQRNSKAYGCPHNTSPHPIRTWSLMFQLDEIPKALVSQRADVSVPVLEKHYDDRDEDRKAEARLEQVAGAIPEYDQAQSEKSNGDIPADSPVEYSLEKLTQSIELPTLLLWLFEDLQKIRQNGLRKMPNKIVGAVLIYCLLTILIESSLLVG